MAEVSTGKFCRLLPPPSPSPESLAVTPSSSMSIPISPLKEIRFPRIQLERLVASIVIPSCVLPAIWFQSGGFWPPMMLS